jgi:hypothetical protein
MFRVTQTSRVASEKPTPNRTFMTSTANRISEPDPDLFIFRCVRSQHENPLRRREIAAASQRGMRTFRQYATNLMP